MEKKKPNNIFTPPDELIIQHQIGKGKSGISYLALLDDRPVVYKQMHDEPCPYYHFSGNKVQLELEAYRILQEAALPIPELLAFDLVKLYLVKEFIDGSTGPEWIAAGTQDEAIISQLFDLSAAMRSRGYNIDFFPANFVIREGRLYYIDYEINPYCYEWGLENWGIYYWANAQGMTEYAKSGDWRGINISADSGIPIKVPFEKKVGRWREKFGGYSNF
jgi:TP53 regulating kinase and related kinases